MKIEDLPFLGTPAQFAVVVRQFDTHSLFRTEAGTPAQRLAEALNTLFSPPESSPFVPEEPFIPPDATIVTVHFSIPETTPMIPGTAFSDQFGRITVRALPGGHSLLAVRLASTYPALAQRWEELRMELERQGWFGSVE